MEYLSQQEQGLIKSSFALLADNVDTLVETFYDHLFSIEPTLRPLFASDMGEQKKKLQKMLTIIVGLVAKPDVLLNAARELGKRHAGYGVHRQDFDAVGESLIFAIRTSAGSAFNSDIESAWLKLYGLLSNVMMQEIEA